MGHQYRENSLPSCHDCISLNFLFFEHVFYQAPKKALTLPYLGPLPQVF